MKLSDLFRNIRYTAVQGPLDRVITDVEIDSRKVGAGCLFIAMRGTQSDGHAYIGKAVQQGASAILCEQMPSELADTATYIQVPDTEAVCGQVTTNFFGNPSSKFELVGVTGTNGKTTIATLLYMLFRRLGYSCGLLSTVCNYIDGKAIPTDHTTPDPITLNRLMAEMADAGCKYVFMECSSHAIAQKRIGGLTFRGGIFTNLTRDHLDYHKTFDNYLKAKKAFFDGLGKNAFAITNLDDRNGMTMVQNTKAKVLGYSLHSICEFKGKLLDSQFDGMMLDINGQETFMRFIGKFNASNLLAVYGAAVSLGQNPVEVLTVMSTLTPVAGRLDTIHTPQGFTAIVDYAHTPDALINVLNSIREVMNGKGTLITVAGAGGNRDKGKRPLMAQAASKLSDRLILTSDNPRFEKPEDILADMKAGLDTKALQQTLTIVDRREAIKTACQLATAGDVVLVAGKGHEDYQEIEGVKHHFDDKEVIREACGMPVSDNK